MSVSNMRSPHGSALRSAVAAAFLAMALVALSPSARTEEPAVWAITNARIVPVSSPVLEKGTIIIRDGIIEAVGASVPIPGDARILDAAGWTVYPGLIDSLSDAGLEEARPQAQPRAAAAPAVPAIPGMPQQPAPPGAPPTDESQGLTPYKQAVEMLSAASRKVESARNAGITTTLVAPRAGFFAGQSSIVSLAGESVGRMVVKTPVAYHVNMSAAGGFGRGYPSSLMGVIAFVRQTLLDAQRYDSIWSQYRTTPGVPRPEYSRALEALQPLLKRQMPAIMAADSPAQVERALAMAESFNLNLILSGGAEAGPVAALLKQKNIPVLLAVKFAERERDADPDQHEEFEALKRRVEAPANAAALAKAGVRFAFMSDDIANPRDFIRNVARTVEAGLDRQTALRALTLTAAEILGIADRFGSIEKNKTASLIVTTGDIFDSATRVKVVFVDGRRFEIPEPETPPERPAGGGAPAAPPPTDASGTWDIVVNSPQGPVDVSLIVKQSGNTLTGSMSSMFGNSDIYEGTVAGNRISFKVTISPPGADTMEVSFTGTIQGTQVSGSASVGDMGPMDFTGSKKPGDL